MSSRRSSALKSPVGFGVGMAVLLANPKAWSMAIAASATYAELVPNATLLALMLGAVFAVVATLATLFWCMGGVMLGSTLRSARQWKTVNLVLAGLTALSIIPLWLVLLAMDLPVLRRGCCCVRRRGSGSGRPAGCPCIRRRA